MVTTSKPCQEKTEISTIGFPDILSWRFPQQLLDFYRNKGISTLFKWQLECLALVGVLEGKNLLFAAPTSSGKTLVAEILMWKRLLETRRKVIYVVPFVSVGREKVAYLQALFKTAGLKVDAYIGSQNSIVGIRSWDVAVSTIEKANNLINRCIEEKNLDLIGMVVIDEFHILGDAQRGYLVELLVTKILQMSRLSASSIQIVAMSATISNLPFLSRWLNAVEYMTTFRPVALSELLYSGGCFHDRGMNQIRKLPAQFILAGDQDNIVGLCLETVMDGYGVLVFCATKNWCEKLSETIAVTFGKIIQKRIAANLSDQLQSVLSRATLRGFLDEYKRLVGAVDPILLRTLPYGVAFHHAGLTMEEREHLERGFRIGIIRVLVATSTLSSGVNLPARRVIIRSPWGQTGATSGPCLTHSAYKQMIGRAGRQGIDVEGESVIVCKRQEIKRGLDLMNGTLESVGSALLDNRRPQGKKKNDDEQPSSRFKRAVLEALVGNLAKSVDEAVDYVKCTLLAAQLLEAGKDLDSIHRAVSGCVDYLLKQRFIELDGDKLIATQLGRATLASAMNPEEAWFMFEDLKQAQRSLVLDSELHMVYLVTPTYMQNQWGQDFDWYHYHRVWCKLSDDQRRVGDLIGVSEAYLLSSSRRRTTTAAVGSNEARKHAVHMRFFTALALYDLVEEFPLSDVAEKFDCNRGFLQALQQQASTYAGMAVAFCDRLGWWYMKTLLAGFAERIAFGVRRELTELVQIDGIDGSRARCFHHSEFTTLASIVYAQANDLAVALRKAVPFKSESDATSGLKRGWLSGHPDMTEDDAVSLIQARAKAILEANLSRLGISLDKCQSGTTDPSGVKIESKEIDSMEAPVSTKEDLSIGNIEYLGSKDVEQTTVEQVNDQIGAGDPRVEQPSLPDASAMERDKLVEDQDNAEEILVNMSRVSITPRSNCDETPSSSRRNSLVKNRFDLEFTDTQLAKIFSPFGSPIQRQEDPLKRLTSLVETVGEDVNAVAANSLSSSGSTFHTPPASLSNSEVDTIRNGTQQLNRSDIDLFDSGVPTSDASGLSDVLISGMKEPDGAMSPAVVEDLDSAIGTTDSQPSLSDSADLFQTPNLAPRKRQRLSRHDSNCSTPSPLTRKYSRRAGSCESIDTKTVESTGGLDRERTSTAGALDQQWTAITQLAPDQIGKVNVLVPCSTLDAFTEFSVEWRRQSRYSICFGTRTTSVGGGIEIVGIAVCWTPGTVHYLPLMENSDISKDRPNGVSVQERLQLVSDCFHSKSEKIAFDIFHLRKLLGILSIDSAWDVVCLRIADWMLSCGNDNIPPVKTIDSLINRYCSSGRIESSNLDSDLCANASGLFIAWEEIEKRLKDRELWTTFVETEMPAASVVVQMEQNGIGFDFTARQSLCSKLQRLTNDLERRAYQLAGRTFSLTSYADLAKVLFVELKLPANGVSSTNLHRRPGRPSKRHYSTSKEVLEKLKPLHALPGVVLDWRKLHNALSTIFPLIKRSHSTDEGKRRVYGTFEWSTATGRVIMQEPSLQVMPRSFNVENLDGTTELVNLRNLIIADDGYILISADYSQLELRILAHLSKDDKLVEILTSADGDVFRIIAAAWLMLPPEKIDDEQRQRAKKLCYGVIYGMGVRSLAEELDVTEETAAGFMDAFKLQFPGVFRWMTDVIENTRTSGFVKTLNGRMRHLPAIRNNCVVEQRLHAERQAVNTSVQGSAADVLKMAMRNAHEVLMKDFAVGTAHRFVLQLHDEVILEAKESIVESVAKIVRWEMENCYQLLVPLRVRLSSGRTWGDLKPMP